MMYRTRKTTILFTLFTLGIVALSAATAWAAPGSSLVDLPRVQDWLAVYAEENGDRSVVLRLEPTRFLLTEKTALRGFAELDLIGGRVVIELDNLDRKVDVWALDNAAGSSILSGDEGDRLIHLARLGPGEGGTARFEAELGTEAFRGFELDWLFVSEAGMEPTESRLLYSSRRYFERLYTKQRLAREGFEESSPPRRSLQPQTQASRQFETKGGVGIADEPHLILVVKGLVTAEQFAGADVFFRETFEGNGRSCGTCHPAENNQTIDGPDFISSLPDSDPLFVAEQRPPTDPISKLEVPALMREHQLIVENVDGLEDPTVKFVMRGVPHSLSLATSTNPDDGTRTGWGGDGAPPPGTLRMFLLGATIQHYPNVTLERIPGIDFRLPTDEELDLNLEFMLGVGRLDDIDLGGVSLKNPDAESGRLSFIGSGCNFCHLNAGANAAAPPPAGSVNRNFRTDVELLDNPAKVTDPDPLDRTDYPFDAGFGTVPSDCDRDGDIDEDDGFGDCTFNTTPLIEAADTAPLFHNNTAETIEDAVAFYSGPPFPGPFIFPGDPETQKRVGAFLRVMNATFNLQIAIQRNEAALELTGGTIISTDTTTGTDSNGVKATVNKLLDLSNDENEDALRVLTDGPFGDLSPEATTAIAAAISLNDKVIEETSNRKRRRDILRALDKLNEANASLGSGTDFTMGAANLLF